MNYVPCAMKYEQWTMNYVAYISISPKLVLMTNQ